MNLSEQGMGVGLRALRRLAGSKLIDRAGLREPVQRTLYRTAKHSTRTAARVGRTFAAASKRSSAARLQPTESPGLFDLTPTDEQEMLREAVRDFAGDRVRPAAQDADTARAVPPEILSTSVDLGFTMLGVPEELGGGVAERSAVTTALMAETLAHGDMGIALACLAPAAVATALGLWGDADQQAAYLPAFVGDDVPAAALAILEPRALFDPFRLETRARKADGGYVLSGVKSLVPRAAQAELFIVAAHLEDRGPALFVLESKTNGLFVEDEPAMGLRAAATGRLVLEDVKLPAGALLAEGRAETYAECVQLGRLGWCALATGTAQAVLDYVIPYVNERVAFGEPISHRQSVAFAVSDIGVEVEGMRLTTYRSAALADRSRPFAFEAGVARRLCAEKGATIGSQGVQLLGGHGYVKEHPVERWYRDLRAIGVMEGGLLI
jgi:alkylation response protein AidB-like acyl-CoA dehydrogenase